jgi:nucleoside-diphosphate-sugar epimerase
MRVTVIGANGFVGRDTCLALHDAGHAVTAVVRRREISALPGAARVLRLDDAGPDADWHDVLAGADAVLQLVSPPGADSPDAAARADYQRVVVDGSIAMARAAAAGSVNRLVFVSSIKVNGEVTTGTPFRPASLAKPQSPYGESKLQAETGLMGVADALGLATTIVRPPVVYGPGNLGNISLLIRFLSRVPGFLVPLSGIENQRALIYVGNLASALVRCVEDDGDASRLFLVRDAEMVTTSELCRLILGALGRSTVLAPDPLGLIRAIAGTARPDLALRLYGSQEIDDDGIAEVLGWTAPFSLADGIARTAAALRDGG